MFKEQNVGEGKVQCQRTEEALHSGRAEREGCLRTPAQTGAWLQRNGLSECYLARQMAHGVHKGATHTHITKAPTSRGPRQGENGCLPAQ